MYTDLFNRLTAGCWAKCSSKKHKEPDLSLGEMSCADRCVAKYLEAQQKVGVILQSENEKQMQQQQSMMQMQQAMGGK